ncbi:hypothetical protein MKY91_17220 [Alkalicoccobacillus gibsonii]|uniref:Uncharacterized protein n=1 Tax=Alkalicoccobacillus gibsonii TaxID=79881 RepID=A0ABU9VLW7_9BACI
MNRYISESTKKNVYVYVPLTVALIYLIMWIFNLSFSLPTTYSEVVKRDMEEKEFEQVRIRMNGEVNVEPYEVSPPADDREFLIDQPDQVNRLVTEEVGLYAVNNGNRLRHSERSHSYDLHLRYADGSSLSYEIADSYIQSLSSGYSTYRVLDDENSLFLYIESLYE